MAQVKPTPPAPGADQPSARQMHLSRRYIELTQSDQMEEAIRSAIVGEANDDPSMREVPAEDRAFLVDLATELTIDLLPQMLDRLVPIYARTFTEEELSALVTFFDTEMGRSIARKSITSMPEANAAMMSVMPQLFDKMATRICARFGCDADEMRAAMQGAGADTPPSSNDKP
ncbi:MAG: DUF2059 domain-containing protein [Brevundimonas sp.]|uniref:DUF2059 domain-containing protein n=1 Tax=Brevundimonas sp. TaxID=1871086 RepID=UPI00248A09F8|nr:DUF2059 domain-containing protein [Brevundimonas sp.]MDI1325443.1 DUF2059 domain-containing protein [Brevundimonas sp.]